MSGTYILLFFDCLIRNQYDCSWYSRRHFRNSVTSHANRPAWRLCVSRSKPACWTCCTAGEISRRCRCVYAHVTIRSMHTYPGKETFRSPSRLQYFTKVMPFIHTPTSWTGVSRLENNYFFARRILWSGKWHFFFSLSTKLRVISSHKNVLFNVITVKWPNITPLFVFVKACVTTLHSKNCGDAPS
jgi:hypothetical protein